MHKVVKAYGVDAVLLPKVPYRADVTQLLSHRSEIGPLQNGIVLGGQLALRRLRTTSEDVAQEEASRRGSSPYVKEKARH